MPRKTKVTPEDVKEKNEKIKKVNKKAISKTTKSSTKKVASKTTSNTKSKKTNSASKTSKSSVKKASTSKSTNKSTKKTTTRTKKTSKVTDNKVASKVNTVEILEYYDLPYRYNQTVVKILVQTPNILFVYWDISDEDKNNYIKEYGDFFFNNTKPVLIVHNLTYNYSFEVDINDFANSWYLHVKDSNCNYKVELGRRPINKYVSIPNNYLFISNSNSIQSPNDHILFELLSNRRSKVKPVVLHIILKIFIKKCTVRKILILIN